MLHLEIENYSILHMTTILFVAYHSISQIHFWNPPSLHAWPKTCDSNDTYQVVVSSSINWLASYMLLLFLNSFPRVTNCVISLPAFKS